MPSPLLIHLHIPKNAGTSLSRMLKLGFLLRPPTNFANTARTLGCYSIAGFENRIAAIDGLPEADRRRIRFFEAHCGWGVHERLPQPSQYVTMLRDPVDRALSVYSYLKSIGRIPPATTLEEFVEAEPAARVWWIDNAQVRYLAGADGHIDDRPIGACTPDMLELARERLRRNFMLVGITEQFNESAALLLRRLRWKLGWYVRSNVTVSRAGAGDVPRRLLDRIRELNELDIALYESERRLFEEQVREGGPSLQADIRRFEQRSALATGLLAAPLARLTGFRRARSRGRTKSPAAVGPSPGAPS
jgi:hypothetical protein